MRVDTDALAWLKSQGSGYQTRMNEILRQAMIKKASSGNCQNQLFGFTEQLIGGDTI